MKYKVLLATLITACCVVILWCAPLFAAADNPAVYAAPIVISELQTGSNTSAAQEFIELYNASKAPISLDAQHWQLQVADSAATSWQVPHRTIALTGTLAAGAYYVAASQADYLPDVASTRFSAGLSATAGHIRLVYGANETQADGSCAPQQTVVDELEWSTSKGGQAAKPSIDGRALYLAAGSGIPAGKSVQRSWNKAGYIDSDNDAADFTLADPTPGAQNIPKKTAAPTGQTAPIANDNCSVTPPEGGGTTPAPGEPAPAIPPADIGLVAPQISELLPNPAPPAQDASDEFIELYNPNDEAFDLSGFTLQAGVNAKHIYVFPPGTLLLPLTFKAFYSSDTKLVLSNTNGQATLLDPFGSILAQSDAYSSAAAGQAWTNASGSWQWTVAPTPNAINQIDPPAVSPVKATAAADSPKKTTAQASAVKAAKTTAAAKPKAAASSSSAGLAPDTSAPKKDSLNPGILAGVALLALLYGAYEYRHDLANKIHQLRANRSARREARQSLARRRSD